MPDQKEGRATTLSSEEIRNREPRQEPSDHVRGESQQAHSPELESNHAGEAADAISDFTQEPIEDATAAEEEYSVQLDAQSSPIEPSMQSGQPAAPQIPVHRVPESSYPGEEYEAGESLDAIQDNIQAGHDGRAHQAGEHSLDLDTSRKS